MFLAARFFLAVSAAFAAALACSSAFLKAPA